MYDKAPLAQRSGADRFAAGFAAPAVRRPGTAKEQMTAWERWEMTSLAQDMTPVPAEPAPTPVVEPLKPELLIDENELARLRLQARQAGEEEGRQQGYAQGQAEGHAAALAAVHEQAGHLRALTQALPAALRLAEREVAGQLLALALDIARQVLGQALALDPQTILPTVRELLQTEPALTGSPQLVLHPDDAALVREHLADDLQTAGWRIRADADTQRGGCRVLAASGERDATLQSRWDRVAAALGPHTAATAPLVHG
ncbi:flagellar assembly protein FliH [Polaromonas sp.]|uniref:flagellar assembly protein FliH n=1 Tax=Polaromonas sp. TaxID=1869339 RepID=UPI002731756E|nr:flagellar assembly protein FliH [Polaromonas sp.]MDP2451536.1 flagellar assembly protein FliH [Polaromonas sp.]MDP3754203.1 flagellar assembly protein FliH [Polaromonas sp.]